MDATAECVSKLAVGATLAELRTLWDKYETFMLPHLHEEEQVGLPLARAYFTPAEIDKLVGKILKNGIPSFVWHLPGGGFKALRTHYRIKMQSHIDSLLAGEPVSARTKKDGKENAEKAKQFCGSESVGLQSALSPCKRASVNSAAHPRTFPVTVRLA